MNMTAMLMGLVPLPHAGSEGGARVDDEPCEPAVKACREAVLEAFRASPSTSTELALAMGVSANAMCMHVSRLRAAGCLREAGVRRTGGRRAVVWAARERGGA